MIIEQKRIFTELEIKKWNEIFDRYFSYILSVGDTGLEVFYKADLNNPLGYTSGMGSGYTSKIDPVENFKNFKSSPFKYRFTFSVSKSRRSEFFNLVDRFIEDGFFIGYGSEKTISTEDLKKFMYQFIENDHKVFNTEMVRVQYDFVDNPIMSMMAVAIIEDSIKFFQKMWGYDEKGNETCLLKYPIGSVVGIRDKKGVDYIVNSLFYARPSTQTRHSYTAQVGLPTMYKPFVIGVEEILYELIEITNTPGSSVLTYGESLIVREEDICASRSNNLNIILN